MWALAKHQIPLFSLTRKDPMRRWLPVGLSFWTSPSLGIRRPWDGQATPPESLWGIRWPKVVCLVEEWIVVTLPSHIYQRQWYLLHILPFFFSCVKPTRKWDFHGFLWRFFSFADIGPQRLAALNTRLLFYVTPKHYHKDRHIVSLCRNLGVLEGDAFNPQPIV